MKTFLQFLAEEEASRPKAKKYKVKMYVMDPKEPNTQKRKEGKDLSLSIRAQTTTDATATAKAQAEGQGYRVQQVFAVIEVQEKENG